MAGATYTISLPKQWVRENKLSEKDELLIYENLDNTLSICTKGPNREASKIEINLNEHRNIRQVIFALYNLGITRIEIVDDEGISKQSKKIIKEAVNNLTGIEIVNEKDEKIIIQLFMDKNKIKINQVLYRMFLIIRQSLLEIPKIEEIYANEEEVNRLYHIAILASSLSLTDSSILDKSDIKNKLVIPSFISVTKKLENIHDEIYKLSKYISGDEKFFYSVTEILKDLHSVYARLSSCIFKRSKEKLNVDYDKLLEQLESIDDKAVYTLLRNLITHAKEIEKDLWRISFYEAIPNFH